jgi:hypothetical protein
MAMADAASETPNDCERMPDPECPRQERPSLFFEEDQQRDENDGAEREEIHDRNERQPDPKPLFRIGCSLKEVRIAGYVFLGDGVTDNEKEEENKHA